MLCTLTTSDCLLPLRLLLPGLAVSTLLCLSTPSPGPASSSEPRFIDTSLEPGWDLLLLNYGHFCDERPQLYGDFNPTRMNFCD